MAPQVGSAELGSPETAEERRGRVSGEKKTTTKTATA